MNELTESTPKSMLPILGAPILVHKIEALPKQIDEVILVVGYLGSAIHNYFGGDHDGRRILYVEQDNPTGGTADALWQARDILQGKFLAMNGDDLYATEDLQGCIDTADWAMLVAERDVIGSGGKVITEADGRIVDIVEGTHGGAGLVNTGAYALDERIFSYTPVPKAAGEMELGLPQTMMTAAKDVRIDAVRSTSWIQITAPEDLKKAEDILASRE